jgi:hypothetical protein
MDELENKKGTVLTVSARVEWPKAEAEFGRLRAILSDEIAYLMSDAELRNAYSPIAWVRLCQGVKHLTEGMAAIRLHCEGKTNEEIAATTGVNTRRVGAYKAWNTQYKRAINRTLRIKGRNKEQREADIAFLRAVGVAIIDEAEVRA